MANILLAWELGEGLGHVQRLLRIARPLAERGHRPVFALANVAEPWPLFQRDGFAVLQAPYWNFRIQRMPFMASSLADVLAVRGWETVDTLVPLVAAWRRLVEMVQPKLIVTDFAPTLCLAAFKELPVVQVGNWFPLPPVDGPTFPLLVPGQAPILPQEELLKVVQAAQRQQGRAEPASLTEIFRGDRFPTFVPEMDPYQADRHEAVFDPMEPLPAPTATAPERRFFAYLTADNPYVEAYLTHLALTGCPGTAYVRSAPAELKERLRLQGLTILDEPANLGEMLAKSAVIIHHAGSTTANAALAAGRPQILFPQHLEQTVTAQLLTRMGLAAFLLASAAPDAAGRLLRQMLADRRYADNATAWSNQLRERPPRPALTAIVECCLGHLKAGL